MNLGSPVTLRNFIWLVFISLPGLSSAQGKEIYPEHAGHPDSLPEYKTEIIRNSPETVARTTIVLNPLVLGFCFDPGPVGHNFLGSQIKINTLVSKKMEIGGSFSVYADISDYSTNNTPLILLPYIEGYIGSQYFFSSDDLPKKQDVWFYSKDGNSLILEMENKKLMKTGIRFNINYLTMPLFGDQVNFIGFFTDDPSRKKINLNTDFHIGSNTPGNMGYQTNLTMPFLSFGLIHESITDIYAKVDGYGKRQECQKKETYFDIIASPFVHYDDILITGKDSFNGRIINIDKFSPKNYFGFRAGWQVNTLKRFGGAFNVEVCYLPNAGVFLNARFGLAYNSKRKKETN